MPDGGCRLGPPDSASIRILKGRVWITEEGRPGDVFLASGEQSRLHGSGLVVIEALGPARIELTEGRRQGPMAKAVRSAKSAFSRYAGRLFTRLLPAVVRATAPGQAASTVR